MAGLLKSSSKLKSQLLLLTTCNALATGLSRSARKKRIEIMLFTEEPTGYEKTILSDLQGAWSLLRDSVVDTGGFEGWDRAIFHIDEAMSWETVRNLKRMPPLLLIIRNICTQGKAPQEVLENIQELDEILKEVLSEIPN